MHQRKLNKKVIRGDRLITVLKEFKSDLKSSKKEMRGIGERILAMNRDDRKEYIGRIQRFVDEDKKNRYYINDLWNIISNSIKIQSQFKENKEQNISP
mgnify:CR=1 FL=1